MQKKTNSSLSHTHRRAGSTFSKTRCDSRTKFVKRKIIDTNEQRKIPAIKMPFGAFYHDKKQKFKQTDDRQHKQMGVGWKVGDTKWKLTDEIVFAAWRSNILTYTAAYLPCFWSWECRPGRVGVHRHFRLADDVHSWFSLVTVANTTRTRHLTI